jgi:uncharacterized protein (TIGR00255 family)
MTISSMTGFARTSGTGEGMSWQWEVKSVNGKALDLRCRLPPGFESLEAPLRAEAARFLKRGSLQVSLSVSGTVRNETIVLNEALLEQILVAGEALRARIGGEPLRADLILGMRGVLDVIPLSEDDSSRSRRDELLLSSFGEAMKDLVSARSAEGARLMALLIDQVGRIAELVNAAGSNPARSVEAIRTRLSEQVARLLEAGSGLDEARLHQEAVLLATRTDIQEELDRLNAHVAAARDLLAEGGAIGRKLDFLAQEFNREANTLCSKAIDRSLTAIGLELKAIIDQMREQVQNIE